MADVSWAISTSAIPSLLAMTYNDGPNLYRFCKTVNATAHHILLDKYLKGATSEEKRPRYCEASLNYSQGPTTRYSHRLHHSVPELRRAINLFKDLKSSTLVAIIPSRLGPSYIVRLSKLHYKWQKNIPPTPSHDGDISVSRVGKKSKSFIYTELCVVFRRLRAYHRACPRYGAPLRRAP
ncbi:uncharacterized protein P174DRAFT_138860 [Aspergillus novofumigatus IBT 16806]|uniref:Uncharacterized protein n=1 Tax=Aspergillus novofumigatus (strain IBT 16806) TaxID=1392255 RepID=A0A2I1CDF9_ASPN1|nr:uncharacterized protein P174DRAFT_138860 [Aspergillus novofumigatus IBT 16806]PKX95651.1 hypothetical protein P174DRAFT_138860 [Aspergillus novofumigatus IBT 16806]